MVELFNSFNAVTYYDEPHKYFIGKQQLTSVTTVIGKYKQPFDADYWSAKKAEERGVSKEQVLAEWDKIKEDACVRGSHLHEYMDHLTHNRVFPIPVVDDLKVQAHLFYNDFIKKNVAVRTEFVVCDEELGIAGMIDLLAYNLQKRQFYIIDYKTNKKFSRNNPYQRYKKPLDHLEECEFNTYSLQTSLYRYIIEKNTGIQLGESYIVWFNEEEESYHPIHCPYLKNDIENVIKHFSENHKIAA